MTFISLICKIICWIVSIYSFVEAIKYISFKVEDTALMLESDEDYQVNLTDEYSNQLYYRDKVFKLNKFNKCLTYVPGVILILLLMLLEPILLLVPEGGYDKNAKPPVPLEVTASTISSPKEPEVAVIDIKLRDSLKKDKRKLILSFIISGMFFLILPCELAQFIFTSLG